MATTERIAELFRSGTITADDVIHHQYKSAHPLAFRLRKRSNAWRRRTLRQLRDRAELGSSVVKGVFAPLLPQDPGEAFGFPRWFLLLMSPFLVVLATWYFFQSFVYLLCFLVTSVTSRLTQLHWRRFRSRMAQQAGETE